MSELEKPQFDRALSTNAFKNLQRADFPLPVGMQIATHSNTGSTHSVPSTCTTEWDILKQTVSNNPANSAIGGILIALAACAQPYKR